jgi:hypothetical protein
VYSIVKQASTDLDPTLAPDLDLVLKPTWAQGSLATIDSLDLVFPFDKVILEALTGLDRPWDDLHHRSYFLPELGRIEAGEFVFPMTEDRYCFINPLTMHIVYAEGNMETITKMIPIYISRTLNIVENVFIGADYSLKEIQIYIDLFKEFCDVFPWSYEENLGIDPRIVEHEITTYPNAKLVRQKLHIVNHQKAVTIKVDVEKLLKAGFICPI